MCKSESQNDTIINIAREIHWYLRIDIFNKSILCNYDSIHNREYHHYTERKQANLEGKLFPFDYHTFYTFRVVFQDFLEGENFTPNSSHTFTIVPSTTVMSVGNSCAVGTTMDHSGVCVFSEEHFLPTSPPLAMLPEIFEMA